MTYGYGRTDYFGDGTRISYFVYLVLGRLGTFYLTLTWHRQSRG